MSLLSPPTRGIGRKHTAGARSLWLGILLLLALAGLNSCGSQGTHLAYVTTGTTGILAFRIHNTSGTATNVVTSPFLVGDATFGMVVHPSNKFALVANQHSGTISRLDIDLTTGALTEKLPRTPAGISPGPMILDSSGNFLFVADQGLNQILVFSVSADGSLSQVSSAAVGSAPTSLTLASTGFLFVPVPSFSAIYVFTVNSGVLTQVCSSPGPVCLPSTVNDAGSSVAVDPAGKFLYLPNPSTNTVSGFTIGSGGDLTPVPGVAFAAGKSPAAAAVDQSGKFLYVVNSGSTAISQYTIDSAGNLTVITGTLPSTGTNPGFITFDPDGKFGYIGNIGSQSVTQFTINSTSGALSTTTNTLQIGSVPRALALTK